MDYTLVGVAVAVMLFTGTAMAFDLRSKTLPNWLNVTALGLALVYQGATAGISGLTAALSGFAVGFGVLLVLWLMGGAGGGDVKMMAALGAWLGAPLTIVIFVASAIVALLGLVITATVSFLRRTISKEAGKGCDATGAGKTEDGQAEASGPADQTAMLKPIPYAVPVAIATWGIMILKLVSAVIVHT